MLPRTTLDDDFGVAVRSMIIFVRKMLERGMESDSDAEVAQHMATRFMEVALEYEKKSQEAAKEASEAAKTAENAKKEAKAWFEILRQSLDDGEANAEHQAVQEGAVQEKKMAHGSSTSGEEA